MVRCRQRIVHGISFISESAKTVVLNMIKEIRYPNTYFEIAKIVKDDILKKHSQLISWMKKLPLYYENKDQIFVHADIDEEAEDYWQHGTSRECFF